MKVTIYSTPTCPYCRMAKEYLKNKGIAFTDIDVSSSRERAQEMIDKSGQMGAPVIIIDDKCITGFDKEALDKAFATPPKPSKPTASGKSGKPDKSSK